MKGQLLVINPGQEHGSLKAGDYQFISIEIEREILGEVASCLGGHKPVWFRNQCLELTADMETLLRWFIAESQNRQTG